MFFGTREQLPYMSAAFIVDSACNLVFLVEVILKASCAKVESPELSGLRAFWHDPWNRLDFVIVLGALLSLVFREMGVDAGLEACALVRAFRPLRFVNYMSAIKVQVNLLIKSLSALGTLALFMSFSMAAYAIVGMQLLKGLYYFCDDGEWADDEGYVANVGSFPANSPKDGMVGDDGWYSARPCSGNFTNATGFPLEAKGEWVNELYNFDDFFRSLLSVYILSVVSVIYVLGAPLLYD